MNRTLEDMMRHFIAPDQTDWDKKLALAEFAINNAVHEGLQTTPFMLNFGQHPRVPGQLFPSQSPAADTFLQSMQKELALAKSTLEAAQQRQRQWAKDGRPERTFNVGDKVWLSCKNIKIKNPGTRKFLPQFFGPLEITKRIGHSAYKLDLEAHGLKIHDVFHVSLLKPHYEDEREQQYPPPIEVDGELEYEVDALLDTRVKKYNGQTGKMMTCKREYLVKFTGYGQEWNQWLPVKPNLVHAMDLVKEYNDTHGIKD
jgi:hypothetical protein